MSVRQQNPLRRLHDRPPKLAGGVALSVALDDDQRGIVSVRHGEREVRLRAVGLSLPYPSGLRRLRAEEAELELVVVQRAPRGLQRLADEEGVNYLDLEGHGRIVAPGFVYVAPPRVAPTGLLGPNNSSPFAPNASRVVRTLLSDPGAAWRLSDIAQLADLNPGNVHRALGALVDLGAVERDEDAYVVVDAGSLLEAWADQARPPRERHRLRIEEGDDLRGTVRRLLGDLGDRGAVVSGELAAEELAPYLPAESALVHVFDPALLARLADSSGSYGLPQGGALRSGEIEIDLADAGYGHFATVRDRLPLASPQQVYVDLARDLGRGRQAAEHVRNVLLAF